MKIGRMGIIPDFSWSGTVRSISFGCTTGGRKELENSRNKRLTQAQGRATMQTQTNNQKVDQMEKRKVSNAVFEAFEKTQHYKQAFIEAEKAIERDHENGIFSEGDLNHPMYNGGYNYCTKEYKLFGYEQNEFLAKQYK